MILNLQAFEDFPAEATIVAASGEIGPFDDNVIRVDSGELILAVQKSGNDFFCQGRIKVQVVLECARCLKEFATELVSKTSFIVCSIEDAEKYQGSDEEEYVFFKGNDLRVDVVNPVRQALALSMSMKPLCSQDCQGLCQQCGTNLNEKSCNCDNKTTDVRWDGLKDLHPE